MMSGTTVAVEVVIAGIVTFELHKSVDLVQGHQWQIGLTSGRSDCGCRDARG